VFMFTHRSAWLPDDTYIPRQRQGSTHAAAHHLAAKGGVQAPTHTAGLKGATGS